MTGISKGWDRVDGAFGIRSSTMVNASGKMLVTPQLYVLRLGEMGQPPMPTEKLWKEASKSGIFAKARDGLLLHIDCLVRSFHIMHKGGRGTTVLLSVLYQSTATWLRINAQYGAAKHTGDYKVRYLAMSDLQTLAGYNLMRNLGLTSLGKVEAKLIELYGKELSAHGAQIDQQNLAGTDDEIIKYCTTEEDRSLFRLHADKGVLMRRKGLDDGKLEPFDTTGMNSTDPDQGVFVMDFDSIYAGAHDASSQEARNPWKNMKQFYHSSFLAGKPVLSAGEIKVRHGTLVALTPKSGHYQGDKRQLQNLILRLQSLGVNTGNVDVVWGYTGMGVDHRPIWQHQAKAPAIFR
jgi:hypothetical protein